MGMTFVKPSNIRYVDMCIYIDGVIKDWDITQPLDEETGTTVYKYLYWLYYNSACRGRYFKSVSDYDEFARWCATKAYMRLVDRRQLTGDMKKIKSIKNYWEATSYGWKIKWQNETFQTVLSEEFTSGFNYSSYQEEYQKNIRDSKRNLLVNDIMDIIDTVSTIIDNVIQQTPYANDKLMCKNLKLSILITIYREISNIKECKNAQKYSYKYSNNIYLWHLDPGMSNMITLLSNRVKEKLIGDINHSMSTFDLDTTESSELTIKDALSASLEDYNE